MVTATFAYLFTLGCKYYAENRRKMLAYLVFILKRLRRKWSREPFKSLCKSGQQSNSSNIFQMSREAQGRALKYGTSIFFIHFMRNTTPLQNAIFLVVFYTVHCFPSYIISFTCHDQTSTFTFEQSKALLLGHKYTCGCPATIQRINSTKGLFDFHLSQCMYYSVDVIDCVQALVLLLECHCLFFVT